MSVSDPTGDSGARPPVSPAWVGETMSMGFDSLIGVEIVQASGERVELRCPLRPELHQPFGLVHGGLYCTLAETAASYGGMLWFVERGHPDVRVVGVNNNTDFLRATSTGVLVAVATPVHRGRLQQLWQILITDQEDRLVARSQVRLQNLVP